MINILTEKLEFYNDKKDKEKWDIFFAGYPNISPKVKFDIIRKYDEKNSWTRNFDDVKLL